VPKLLLGASNFVQTTTAYIGASDVNKDLNVKAKARTKNLTLKAKYIRTKELTLKAKDMTKDLAAECTQGLYKDLHFEFT